MMFPLFRDVFEQTFLQHAAAHCAAAFVAWLSKTVVPRDNRVYLIIAATASELY